MIKIRHGVLFKLSDSLKTLEKHRQSLLQKLEFHKIADLTRYAISNGVIESDAVRNIAR
jgi:hypothetical protein